jgi:hypothetical protein
VLIDFNSSVLFLKPQKCASTSVEIYLRQFMSENTFGHLLDDEGESLSALVGGVVPMNVRIPPVALSRKQLVAYVRSGFASRPRYRPHHPASSVRKSIGAQSFQAFSRVSVMRNPFDRVASLFYWRTKSRLNLKEIPLSRLQESFSMFLSTDLAEARRLFDSVYKIRGKAVVSHWLRYENLQQDLERVTRELFPRQVLLPHVPFDEIRAKANHRPGGVTNAMLYGENRHLAERVVDEFQWDFETFDYSREVQES